ncbi:ABC transporter ATP-binding protein/permease [Carbonactinospora thermoautotrophica]|uniref:ABC transporter ATP-binding protein/permease n=1 Tax=Carbonactinospora thermoautotrophica TaxID=1469144 RepID=UPI0022715AC1|nr:ABC transporter ATP-binding protein/permease [Carbonactinospora thermoautotrophica]
MGVLEVRGLVKRFGSVTAVNGVDLTVEAGEIVALLGPNGAGKTTTLHVVLGLVTPDVGQVRLFGRDLARHRTEALSRLNFASGYVSLPGALTVEENLLTFAYLYAVRRPRRRVAELMELMELQDLRRRRVRQLSSGQQTRVQLAKALLNEPELLVLDEPTASLDPDVGDRVREVLVRPDRVPAGRVRRRGRVGGGADGPVPGQRPRGGLPESGTWMSRDRKCRADPLRLPPMSPAARRRRVLGVVLRDFYVLRRSVPRAFEIVYWPLVELLIWGYLSVFLQGRDVPMTITALLGGVLLWQILFRSQSEVSLSFLEDVWSRNLLNVFSSPLSGGEYRLVLFGALKLALGTAVMATLAFLLYGFGLFSLGPALLPFVVLLLVMGWALGIATVAVVIRFGQSAEVIAWALAFAFQPFAAVFYPVDVLPPVMRAVAQLVPASFVFEGMRDVLAGHGIDWSDLGLAAALDTVYLGALALFARMLTTARSNGSLSRFGE